jgi:hypothetical protein
MGCASLLFSSTSTERPTRLVLLLAVLYSVFTDPAVRVHPCSIDKLELYGLNPANLDPLRLVVSFRFYSIHLTSIRLGAGLGSPPGVEGEF